MSDSAHIDTDKKIKLIENRLAKEYKQAERELKRKTNEYLKAFKKKDKQKKQLVAEGKLSKDEWIKWRQGQMYIADLLKNKTEIMAQHLSRVNEQATNIVNGMTAGVYANNYNYAFYQLEKGLGAATTFTLFDTSTVERLAAQNPKLLPTKKLDKTKDVAWSKRKINNAVTQGILQGEAVEEIAERMASDVARMSWATAMRTARTTMTSAQNAGRLDSLMQAAKMGINVQKQWMATLDEKTRDSHAAIDGESVPLDKPFSNKLMYPADPDGAPAEVYNCRCTMVGDLLDHQHDYQRIDNIEGKPIDNMTYNEWKAAKQGDKVAVAQAKVDAIQKKIMAKGADKVFSNIWKDDVTYADYDSKKGSIQAKKDYYDAEIAKYSQTLANDPNAPSWVQKKHDDLVALKSELEEFERYGAEYSKLLKELDAAQDELDALQVGKNAFTQKQRDAAIWAKSPDAADKVLRDVTGETWQAASKAEKDAIYEYTKSYHKYQEPLRGWEYGTNRFLGVGKTDLNASYANNGRRLNNMTKIIDKSKLKKDQWFQRGCNYSGMDKFFDCDLNLLMHGTEEELKKELLGKTVTEYGFFSMGSSKGSGFIRDITLNVFAPKGTKAIYVEPFSYYGAELHQHGWGKGVNWDGKRKQTDFGQELETILQQGTKFKVIKVERKDGRLFIDLDIISQGKPQLWKGKK